MKAQGKMPGYLLRSKSDFLFCRGDPGLSPLQCLSISYPHALSQLGTEPPRDPRTPEAEVEL